MRTLTIQKTSWIMSGIKTVLALLVLICTRYVPGAADWYTRNIYPLFVSTLGRVSGWFPFSVVEVLLYALLIAVFIRLCQTGRKLYRKEQSIRAAGAESVRHLASFASALLLMYMLTCGANYYNTSFAELYGMQIDGYELEQLLELTQQLTEDVNRYGELVEREADGTTKAPEDVQTLATEAMAGLAEDYPALAGYYPRPKSLLISEILSYQSLSGIYSPFTVEANYNGDIMGYNIPFTACHELSHLRGFMREDEANFIAYLACVHSEEVVFQYGGSLVAWIHTMNTLYKYEPELHAAVYEQLSDAVLTDLRANSEFWSGYKGTVSKVSDKVNDTYLKANRQEHGVQSYGRMVNLLIYYHTEE